MEKQEREMYAAREKREANQAFEERVAELKRLLGAE